MLFGTYLSFVGTARTHRIDFGAEGIGLDHRLHRMKAGRTLPNLILFPANDALATRNLDQTVKNTVPFSRIEHFVRKQLRLKLQPYAEDLHVWGVSPSRFNTQCWRRFRKNDLSVFLSGDEFILAGRVIATTNSEAIARDLWQDFGRQTKWNLIIFMHRVRAIHMPLARFVEDVGFGSGYSTHKTIILTDRPLERLLGKYGSIEGAFGLVPTAFSDIFWQLIHPTIEHVSRPRFRPTSYADSVEAALKEVNTRVKRYYHSQTGRELDGADLMHTTFSPRNSVITLDSLATESGRNIQQGYMELFAGAMTGIRNPKAHEILQINIERAIHFLFLASLLMFKLDEAHVP